MNSVDAAGMSRTPNSLSWPTTFDLVSNLHVLYGERYSGYWLGVQNGTDPPLDKLFVAVVGPTADDAARLAQLQYVGTSAVLVKSLYSETDLNRFRDAIQAEQLSQGTSNEARVTGVGLGVRNDDLSETGQPVVVVFVSACDSKLLDLIAKSAPADATDVRQLAAPHRN